MATFNMKTYKEAHAENEAFDRKSFEGVDLGGIMGPEYASVEPMRGITDEEVHFDTSEVVTELPDQTITISGGFVIDDEDAVIEALEIDYDAPVVLELENGETLSSNDVVLEPQASNSVSFDQILASISDDDAKNMALRMAVEIDERADFERAKGNDNIQKALAKSRKQLTTFAAARVLIACEVNPSMINRSVHEGVRYNVYALGKLADAIHGLNTGSVNNAINVACMKSLFRFNAAGKEFTGEMAKACASDKIKVDTGLKGMLVRHTVSASTASTQASSTMQALTTLGIVVRSGSHKNPTFNLAVSSVVEKLRAACGEAIAA